MIKELVENKNFYSFTVKDRKTQIMLCHTGRDASNYYNSLKYRMDGEYKKIPHYLVTKEGYVVNLISPKSSSEFFGKPKIDNKTIFITLENLGWLKRNSRTGKHVNWIGDIYKGEVFRKKWRGHLFWASYTIEQLNALSDLIVQLNLDLGIKLEFVGHNVKVDRVEKFKGLVSRSNYNDFWTDVSPAFDFEELIKLIKHIK